MSTITIGVQLGSRADRIAVGSRARSLGPSGARLAQSIARDTFAARWRWLRVIFPLVLILAAPRSVPLCTALGDDGGWGLYQWASDNWYQNPPTNVPFFNTQEWIEQGRELDLVAHPELATWTGDYLVVYALRGEFGIRVHISAYDPANPGPLQYDPAHPEHTRQWKIATLAQYFGLGATLKGKIRHAPAGGGSGGSDIEEDLPLVDPAASQDFPALTDQQLRWVEVEIDLPDTKELTVGDYYFCVEEHWPAGGQPQGAYYGMAMDTVGWKAGLATMSVTPPWCTWITTYANPMIVVRQGDPTPTHSKPVARISVDHTSIHAGDSVQLDGQYSYDSENPNADPSLLTYEWNFGDDTTDDVMTPPAHTYGVAGTYTVTLRVKTPWAWSDPVTQDIEVQPNYPPRIGGILIYRTTGPNAPKPTSGVYTGDGDTKVKFEPGVEKWDEVNQIYVPCHQPDCTLDFHWSDNLDQFSQEYEDVEAPCDTVANLGLSTVGQHWVKLTVTDTNTGMFDSCAVVFYICDLPLIMTDTIKSKWDRDFKYHVNVTAMIRAGQVGLEESGYLKLTTPDGAQSLSDPVDITKAVGPGELFTLTQPLVRNGEFQWDPMSGGLVCSVAITELDLDQDESLNIKAYELKDTNGHEIGPYTAFPQPQPLRVTIRVSDGKRLAYNTAMAAFYDAAFWTGFAIGAGLASGGVGAVIGGAVASGCAWTWQHECAIAHDPIEPDADYYAGVPMAVPPLAVGRACAPDDGTDDGLRGAEAGGVLRGATDAYVASVNKLAGVYTFWHPGDPQTFESVAALQGSQVVRYGKIMADALTGMRDAWMAASGAISMTTQELIDVQAQVGYEGLPSWFIAELIYSGIDPGTFTAMFLQANPNATVDDWGVDHSADLDENAKFLLGQSYFLAPSGLVLVGITWPLDGAGVQGMITIDARVVHKKPETVCPCGDTIVTQVLVDGNVISQMPPPPPNCDGANPAPSGVPATYNSDLLAEGLHTITVVASDGIGQPWCQPQPGEDPLHHTNGDTITVYVDRTPPQLAITSADVDPGTPGIQVFAGDLITYTASDIGSGLVGPPTGTVPTGGGSYLQTICVADRAGNVATEPVEVIRPYLDNGVIRARLTDYGASGQRFPLGTGFSAEIAWLPVAANTQVYSWEGNLRYDAGSGPANHLLSDPTCFAVKQGLRREGDKLVSRFENNEFAIVATHWLDGATLTTKLEITNRSDTLLTAVNFAWLVDGDLALPDVDPCCAAFPWLGFGAGRWFPGDGQGLQTNLNECGGQVPPTLALTHTARLDGTEVPGEWTVSNPSGLQGTSCAFDGSNQCEPRYLFTSAFDNTAGCAGFDQDLAIATSFAIANWPALTTHTLTYTITFQLPGDINADGQIDLGDFSALAACLTGPETGLQSAPCAIFDFTCDDDVDLGDFAAFQRMFWSGK